MRGLLVGLLLLPAPVSAEETWHKVTSEAEVLAALDDRFMTFEHSKQWFYKSGKTLNDAGHPSWGNWRPQGAQYCSEWPPNANWTCYDLFLNSDKSQLRFVGPGGDLSDGTYGVFKQ